ncbi:PilW family protein [Roseateles sp. NT4]|uniref:PilW family protein n=1 Tax=Roseateles sp. NT4 TaxID=3453715 RepID=UPI003EEFD4CD
MNGSSRALSVGLGRAHRVQRGVSLVELMVGVTVGLIVTAGAALVATQQINEHRRLMLEVQLQQDLRVTAELLQRDLRRAGYRGVPASGVWEPERGAGAIPAKEAASSPYTAASANPAGDEFYYRYARTVPGTTAINASNVVASNEQFGIRWNSSTKALYLQLGMSNGQPNWQPITDPDLVLVQHFSANVATLNVPLDDLCDPSCTAAGTCPTQAVRLVNFTITAVARSDSRVRRTLNVSEKIRADAISGACPSAAAPAPPPATPPGP